jgi:putative transposase
MLGPAVELAKFRAEVCTYVAHALAARHQAHEAGQRYLTDAELSARLTAAKATTERAWLNEVSAVVLQQALADLNTAYRNYFASLAGTRKGPKAGPPRFRSRKDTRQAIRFTANARFTVLPNGKLRLPKIGDVPVRWSRPHPPGQIRPRRRMVRVRGDAGVQGPAVRPGVPPDRPVRADLADLLGVRRQGRPQAAARPRMAVRRVRGAAGPGHKRGGQRR